VAALLGASRQHVVDLCDRGDLPYTTTGTHRRIRRADVERLRTASDRLTRDQQRSLRLAYATAGRIVADPDRALTFARGNLDRMGSVHRRGQATRWLREWEKLLDGPLDDVLAVLTSPSPRSRELRQNSPFAGLLDDAERREVLEAFTSTRSRHAL
jgi:excisionase family DNA binding protein